MEILQLKNDIIKYGEVITNINANTVVVGKNTTIIVAMANVTSGTLVIEVGKHNYTVEIVNKVANLTVGLPVGNYTAKAYFLGNDRYNATESNTVQSKVLSKFTPQINIVVPNKVNVGECVNISVYTNGYNLTVWINDVKQDIVNGNISFVPAKAGLYTIVAKVSENDTFYSASNITVFNAVKLNATLNISKISPELNKEFVVNIVNVTDGEITIKVNGEVITGGKFTPTVPGGYLITVESASTDKYNAGFNMTLVIIDIKNSTVINIDVPKEVKVGECVNISVSTDGYNLTVWINGEKQNITDGSILYTVIDSGIYVIRAETSENDTAYGAFKTVVFTSVKNNATLSIDVAKESYYVGEVFDIGINNDTGVNVTVNGKEYLVVEGKVNVHDLGVGQYIITATVMDLDNYNALRVTKVFNIIKYNSSVNVIVNQLKWVMLH